MKKFTPSPLVLGIAAGSLVALAVLGTTLAFQTPEAVGNSETPPVMEGAVVEALEAELKIINYNFYKVAQGDTISGIADANNLNSDTLLTYNEIKRSRALQIGTILKVPNQDGLLYTVKSGDSLESVAEKFEVPMENIQKVNRMAGTELTPSSKVFLPGARLNNSALREINGDLFRMPIGHYRLTSYYGYRRDPFTGGRSFHNGLDMAAPTGTPVYAPMEGVVTATGYSNGTGNYVVLRHHGGYSTLYGHLSGIYVQPGVRVGLGAKIGAVGNTGYSTGSHLHFTVYQNGRTINPIYVLN